MKKIKTFIFQKILKNEKANRMRQDRTKHKFNIYLIYKFYICVYVCDVYVCVYIRIYISSSYKLIRKRFLNRNWARDLSRYFTKIISK